MNAPGRLELVMAVRHARIVHLPWGSAVVGVMAYATSDEGPAGLQYVTIGGGDVLLHIGRSISPLLPFRVLSSKSGGVGPGRVITRNVDATNVPRRMLPVTFPMLMVIFNKYIDPWILLMLPNICNIM
jgi:hypothetical protein